MNQPTSHAISAQTVVILRQLQKDGTAGTQTARHALENLGLSSTVIWALIKDTLGLSRGG